MTSTLLTPWHDLDRLARALIAVNEKEAATVTDDDAYDAYCERCEAEDAFRSVATPAVILSLLDAARDAEKWRLMAFMPLGDNHHNARLCPYCNPPIDAARAVPPALDGPANE